MPGQIDLPAVDRLTSRWAVFETSCRKVDLSAPVAQFLFCAGLEGVVPILVTTPGARIGLQLAMEMLRCGGQWAIRNADGTLTHGLFGYHAEGYDELVDRLPRVHPNSSNLPEPDRDVSFGVLGFELMVHHRATEQVRVGAIAEHVVGSISGAAPDCWGSTQPLNREWDREALTRVARSQMPNSSFIRGSAPDGSQFVLHYERTSAGVTERLRGACPLGPYRESVADSVERSVAMLKTLERRHVVVAGMTTMLDLEADLSQTARRRFPEVPCAMLAGPWALRSARTDVAVMEREFGAQRLGRAAVGSLLFRFDAGAGRPAPWEQLARVFQRTGLDNIARTLGRGRAA